MRVCVPAPRPQLLEVNLSGHHISPCALALLVVTSHSLLSSFEPMLLHLCPTITLPHQHFNAPFGTPLTGVLHLARKIWISCRVLEHIRGQVSFPSTLTDYIQADLRSARIRKQRPPTRLVRRTEIKVRQQLPLQPIVVFALRRRDGYLRCGSSQTTSDRHHVTPISNFVHR